MLNLFLALLINAFGSDEIDKHKESASESNRIGLAIERLKHMFCCCCPFIKNKVKPSKDSNDSPDSLISIPEDDKEKEENKGEWLRE